MPGTSFSTPLSSKLNTDDAIQQDFTEWNGNKFYHHIQSDNKIVETSAG